MRLVDLAFLLLPFAALAQTSLVETTTTRGVVEQRMYTAENGRRIRITSLGNLVGLESPFGFEHIANPGGAREGYVLAYTHPETGRLHVVHNVNDIYSALLGGPRDLVPQTFRAPADGSVFEINTPVTATAVVDTSDGLLRLTHEFSWSAGTGKVTITTTIANRGARRISLRGFKRHAAIDLDGHGQYGRAAGSDSKPDRASNRGITSFSACACPLPEPGPRPGPGWAPSIASHLFSITGAPEPAYNTINARGDIAEVISAGYQPTSNLPSIRRSERNSATLGWSGDVLSAGGSAEIAVDYAVQ